MRWYNPETLEVENVRVPSTDEEALGMLWARSDSGRPMERYVVLREEGLGVGQAFLFVGHRLRMFRPGHLNLGRARKPQRCS